MSIQISKKAELFYKAMEDIWVAEQIWQGSPNNAVWHCTQAVEKTMKGFLRCLNKDYEYGHELKDLLDAIDDVTALSTDVTTYILYFDRFGVGLRYRNMTSDPTIGEAKSAIGRAKLVLGELECNVDVARFVNEAREVHHKMLRLSLQYED